MDTVVPAMPQPPLPVAPAAQPVPGTAPPPPATLPEPTANTLSLHLGHLAQARPFGTIAAAVVVGMGLASLVTLIASQHRHGRWHA